MTEESLTGEKGKRIEDIRKEAEEKACAVQRVLYFLEEFLAGPMCGKCFPCSLGTAEARVRANRLSGQIEGAGAGDIRALKRIGLNMMEGSFCKKGRDTGKFIVDTLSGSQGDVEQHISGVCAKKECPGLVEYVINPRLCTMCGKCSEVCKHRAVWGEKRVPYLSGYSPFEIRQKRCTKCGECVKVCPTGAIEVVSVLLEELIAK
jgi:NAD-dependent dihydropyrimidine dehydrogenase PreA subunit